MRYWLGSGAAGAPSGGGALPNCADAGAEPSRVSVGAIYSAFEECLTKSRRLRLVSEFVFPPPAERSSTAMVIPFCLSSETEASGKGYKNAEILATAIVITDRLIAMVSITRVRGQAIFSPCLL